MASPAPTPSRTISLGSHRRVVIRPVEPTDLAGLDALYEGLDLEDRHRRFFSAYHPGEPFLIRLTTAAERGAVALVAEALDDHDRSSEIVAEAGFEPLANGDAELGITVARSWRGWLGPYLLEVLLGVAQARGIPNLEAEVLVTNGPMLAMARRRDAVDLAQPDWTVVRLLIATADGRPHWPPADDRARVLVEGGGGGWRTDRKEDTDRVVVLSCGGPEHSHSGCPALDGRPCPLAAEADAIVMPAGDHGPWSALAAAHAEVHPGVPVCIAPSSGGGARDVVALAQRHHRFPADEDPPRRPG